MVTYTNEQIDTIIGDFLSTIADCDALLVLPPFAGIDRPSLGLHTLQACAQSGGFAVKVLYANLIFARLVGEREYEDICYAPTADLLGERIFSIAAYSELAGGTLMPGSRDFRTSRRSGLPLLEQHLQSCQGLASAFADRLGAAIASRSFAVVGCNTTFEQTSAAISILAAVKKYKNDVITIVGGANCEGDMAYGIQSLARSIDVIFSGESEVTFVNFLRQPIRGKFGAACIVNGVACSNLDGLPNVNYADFYAQLALLPREGFIRSGENVWLPYETSRGCWWGQKHHCTFCGINGGGMVFRAKSSAKVLEQLRELVPSHPTNKILMVDNIMPLQYFDELLPHLAKEDMGLHIFYEQKANLSLQRVKTLKDAGVRIIQPGIEALSTSLLRLMKKGVTAAQNVALLRYAKSVDMSVNWNLLYAFPGDDEASYWDTLTLMPLLTHLNPPSGSCHLSIDRFSPYFDHPADYGIQGVKPMDAYFSIFPPSAPIDRIAYHFVGEYDSAARRNPELAEKIQSLIDHWRLLWSQETQRPPVLLVEELDTDTYMMIDTRNSDESKHKISFINEAQARLALVGASVSSEESPGVIDWALCDARVAAEIDGRVVPLATAHFELLFRLEASMKQSLRDVAVAPGQ